MGKTKTLISSPLPLVGFPWTTPSTLVHSSLAFRLVSPVHTRRQRRSELFLSSFYSANPLHHLLIVAFALCQGFGRFRLALFHNIDESYVEHGPPPKHPPSPIQRGEQVRGRSTAASNCTRLPSITPPFSPLIVQSRAESRSSLCPPSCVAIQKKGLGTERKVISYTGQQQYRNAQ